MISAAVLCAYLWWSEYKTCAMFESMFIINDKVFQQKGVLMMQYACYAPSSLIIGLNYKALFHVLTLILHWISSRIFDIYISAFALIPVYTYPANMSDWTMFLCSVLCSKKRRHYFKWSRRNSWFTIRENNEPPEGCTSTKQKEKPFPCRCEAFFHCASWGQ